MHINRQWAMDYGDLQVTLKECQIDCEIARREGRTLKEENTSLKAELQALKVKLEETGRLDTTSQEHNLDLLKQQLKVYQEDFAVERREKERLKEEKENERLRLQAEVTSLQLQLDRCRTELTHYSSETTRLAHQLKIRCQADQEQYRGSPEGKRALPGSRVATDSAEGDHPNHEFQALPLANSKSPVPLLVSRGSPVPPPVGRESPVPPPVNGGSPVPPLADKGKHMCPRCSRRFSKKPELNEHKTKCLQY
eukprot:Em0002g1820a